MTQTNYLTGSYSSDDWYADLTSMDAASLVSLSTAVAYTVPFLGGILADKYFGDYKTILFGVSPWGYLIDVLYVWWLQGRFGGLRPSFRRRRGPK